VIVFESGSRLRFIGDRAILSWPNLTSFFIPASVERIGSLCLAYCQSLAVLTVERGSRMESMGERALCGCRGLQIVHFPRDLRELSRNLFGGCCFSVLRLESMSQLSRIRGRAFEMNHQLRSVLIPRSVLKIGCSAFSSCVVLSEVSFELHSELVVIGVNAFYDCKSLTEFRVVGSVEAIAGDFAEGASHHLNLGRQCLRRTKPVSHFTPKT
jgi:hypothetical protein